jgi:malate dehydrogenase (oxaloacetate-decarboxylating)
MAISIGKLAIYTAAAGIHPGRVIPVMLDVGTDRRSLLEDPVYVGNRHARVRGPRYDELVAAYVDTASRLFPHALLHFEDFGPSNARRILEQYRDHVRVFNDDMQGTGAITLAAILAGISVAGSRPADQRVVIFGAGTAGVGVADQIRAVMVDDGLLEEEATRRFWCVDRQGLLVDDMDDLRDFQATYARPRSELSQWRTAAGDGVIGLADVVANVHPTILVGTSTQGGAFTEAIVREMAAHTKRPMIFPMSNPTELIEAVPADLIQWTDGRGLVGTGTPWAPVRYDGVDYEIGQANNALIYPGIGLGTIVSQASRVTDRMLLAAAHALASLVGASRPGAGVLPSIENLRSTSATVAVGVARQAIEEGVAQVDLPDPERAVRDAMWTAALTPLEID